MNVPLLPGRIEHWPLARLKPYARNAKTHDVDQVAKIAASMAEFGWTVPVLVAADGELIAGHGRILAAAHLGLSEAPVIVLGHLTEAQRRAYRPGQRVGAKRQRAREVRAEAQLKRLRTRHWHSGTNPQRERAPL
jgi:ParB-like chromosome segregation protein Spo0J